MTYHVTATFTIDATSHAEAVQDITEYLALASGWVEREAIKSVAVDDNATEVTQ